MRMKNYDIMSSYKQTIFTQNSSNVSKCINHEFNLHNFGNWIASFLVLFGETLLLFF